MCPVLKKYTSGPLGWLMLFILVFSLAYGVFLWTQSAEAPGDGVSDVGNVGEGIEVVEEGGKTVIRNEEVGYEFDLKETFVRQDNNTLFDTSNGDFCKLTIDNLIQDVSNFDDWLKVREQSSGVTILNRKLTKIEHNEFDIYVYDIEIMETGENKILYIKRPNSSEVTQIVAFSDSEKAECYKNFERIIDSIRL